MNLKFDFSKLYSILKDRNDLIGILYGIGLFLLADPFFMWHTESLKYYIIIFLFLISLPKIKAKINPNEVFLLTLLFILLLLRINDFKVLGAIAIFFPMSFLLINRNFFNLTYKWFKLILSISILLSAINYILVVVFSISMDYTIIEPLVRFKSYDYKQYTFFVMPNGFDNDLFEMFRFIGMFDESGVVGTFCAIIIVIERFKINSFSNILIFVGGLLSLSFFYVLTVSFFSMYYLSNKNRIYVVAISIIVYFLTIQNPIIYTTVWERLEIEDGKLKGENRTSDALDRYYESFLQSNDVIFGKGINYIEKLDNGSSASYKQFIINNGVLYSGVTLFFFLLYGYFNKSSNKNFLAFVLVFLFTVYQRPFIYHPIYFYLIIAFVRVTYTKEQLYRKNFKEAKISQLKTIKTKTKTNKLYNYS